MSTTAQNLAHLREGVIAYTLSNLGSTTQQLALHNVSFSETLTTLAEANSSLTCPDCGEHWKPKPGMKAQERLDELSEIYSGYVNGNLLRAAREIRKMGGTTDEIQQYIADHIDCDDQEHIDCADLHAQQEQDRSTTPGQVAVQ
jgi:hypothetical protein